MSQLCKYVAAEQPLRLKPYHSSLESRFECVYEGSKRLREEGSDLTRYDYERLPKSSGG
jgi:hypothetical protein